MRDIEIVARAKAFSNEGVREHKFLVSEDAVSVWDPIAGHYTTCNSLTQSAQKRIRKLASEKSEAGRALGPEWIGA